MLPRWLMGNRDSARLNPKERYIRKIDSLDRHLASFTPRSDQQTVIEKIRQLSEVLIYCDRHQPELLGYFLEKQIHHRFFGLLNQNMPTEVLLQFLQTLSIIVDSVKNENFMYYLLSNNYINKIIKLRFDGTSDEVLAYYVSFLKTLSLKLTPDAVPFFFNVKSHDFPLYTSAIRYFDHEDTMIRIAVKSITLNVYKSANEPMLQFITQNPSCRTYFNDLVRSIRTKHDLVCSLVKPPELTQRDHSLDATYSQINQILEEHLETIAYINDILGLGISVINLVLAQSLLTELLYPVFWSNLVSYRVGKSDDSMRSQAHVSLVFLNHLVMTLKYPSVINEVATLLFSEEYPATSALDSTEGTAPAIDVTTYLGTGSQDRLTMPFLCLCFFLLRNKAIGPSVLAQTTLCPRRFTRTKDILHSLMGSADAHTSDSLSQSTSHGCEEECTCVFSHQHPLYTGLVDYLTAGLTCRTITIDLCAVVLLELIRSADPLHVVCSQHTSQLQATLAHSHDVLNRYLAREDSSLGALAKLLDGLNMDTFEQRMFNAILEASITFPNPKQKGGVSENGDWRTVPSENHELNQAVHMGFFAAQLLRGPAAVILDKNNKGISSVSAPLHDFYPRLKEKQILVLDKYPHIPVTVQIRSSSREFTGFVLSDEAYDLVLVEPLADLPGQVSIVVAASLADLRVERPLQLRRSQTTTALLRIARPTSPTGGLAEPKVERTLGHDLHIQGEYCRPGFAHTGSIRTHTLELTLRLNDGETTLFMEKRLRASRDAARKRFVEVVRQCLFLD
ncbi:Protein CL16A [Dispira parvispora]|uniref:Protein CL16A n=1 Tax=Dispira parvispora TaxID=1520584 RepID=A0A9W8B0R6_9FUNG|nr:Protein CL16A [Dispira parvispora]